MTVPGQLFSVERILFATDFSAVSNNAASYARALARRFSSSVEIAHVFDPASVKSYEKPIVSRTEEERRRLVEDELEHLREDFSALGINARTVSREGHRASVSLLKIVKEQRIDLIVAGTHSKSGMERLVLGSTAEQLIRSAACPVFTVGPHAKNSRRHCSLNGSFMRRTSCPKQRKLRSTRFISRRIAEHTSMSVMWSLSTRRV